MKQKRKKRGNKGKKGKNLKRTIKGRHVEGEEREIIKEGRRGRRE